MKNFIKLKKIGNVTYHVFYRDLHTRLSEITLF